MNKPKNEDEQEKDLKIIGLCGICGATILVPELNKTLGYAESFETVISFGWCDESDKSKHKNRNDLCVKCNSKLITRWSGETICTNLDCDFEDDSFSECSSCGKEDYLNTFDSNGYCLNCQAYYEATDNLL